MRLGRPTLLIATVLLSSCGEYNFTPVPSCAKDEYLTGDGKALKCVALPKTETPTPMPDLSMPPPPPQDLAMSGPPPLVVPTCGPGRCLTGDNAGMLQCVDVAASNQTLLDLSAKVAALEVKVTNLDARVTKLEGGGGGGGGAGATFVGTTKFTTPGLITRQGSDNGVSAAAGRCVDEFMAGAHMCTVPEIYASVLTGKLAQGKPQVKSWVYAPAWQNTTGGTNKFPLQGVGDNCAGYTYPTADIGLTGVAFEWGPSIAPNQAATYIPMWHGGANAKCNAVLPIACCK